MARRDIEIRNTPISVDTRYQRISFLMGQITNQVKQGYPPCPTYGDNYKVWSSVDVKLPQKAHQELPFTVANLSDGVGAVFTTTIPGLRYIHQFNISHQKLEYNGSADALRDDVISPSQIVARDLDSYLEQVPDGDLLLAQVAGAVCVEASLNWPNASKASRQVRPNINQERIPAGWTDLYRPDNRPPQK